MLCGFQRGDLSVFEVNKKWERVEHLSKCHRNSIVSCSFLGAATKDNNYDFISADNQGVIKRHSMNVVKIFDRMMITSKTEKIFEKGNCVMKSLSLMKSVEMQPKSWWNNAKSFFTSSPSTSTTSLGKGEKSEHPNDDSGSEVDDV